MMDENYKLKNYYKYCDLVEFGNNLQQIINDCHFILKQQNINRIEDLESLDRLALSILLMEHCNFRVGNLKYKNSTGLLSIETKHFDINTNNIKFNGKKQVLNSCFLNNKEIIKEIRLLWNKVDNEYDFSYDKKQLLFSYDGGSNHVTPDDLNNFLKIYHPSFSAKMFRTYKANIYFLEMIKSLPLPNTKTDLKKNIKKAVQYTSQNLYNTPAICRRSYIDNRIINLYESDPTQLSNIELVDLLKSFCNLD
jgi:DNA topoisomerase-1